MCERGLLDIVHVYMYTGIKVYDSICILSLYTACLPAETLHTEACSSLELLYESVYMYALPDDVYMHVCIIYMYVCMSTLH